MASNNSNRGRGDISYGRTFNAGPSANAHDDRDDDNNSRSEPPVRLLDDAIEKLVHLRAGVSLIEQIEMEELMDCCDKLKRQVKSIDERLKAVEQAVSELKRKDIAASTSQQSETWASPTLSARQDSHKKPAKKKEEDKKWRLLGSFSMGSGPSPRSRWSADRGPPKPSTEQQQQQEQEGQCFGEGERWSVNDSPWRGKRAEWKGKERKRQDDEEGSGSGEDWV